MSARSESVSGVKFGLGPGSGSTRKQRATSSGVSAMERRRACGVRGRGNDELVLAKQFRAQVKLPALYTKASDLSRRRRYASGLRAESRHPIGGRLNNR